jgi:cell division protein FtsB
VHKSLEKIKEYSSYYDWYDHISIYDLRFLIAQAEKVEQYQRDKEFDESIMQDYEKALQEKEEEIQQLKADKQALSHYKYMYEQARS